jgi:hypothetical protein
MPHAPVRRSGLDRPARSRNHRMRVPALTALGIAAAAVLHASPVRAEPFSPGDVFLGVRGAVWHYDAQGNLLESLPASPDHNTGCAFDATGNLYVTGFEANTIIKFSGPDDPHTSTIFGSAYDSSPESIVFDAGGNAYVGQANGSQDILKFDAGGALLQSFDPVTGPRGTDWIDLATDHCTMFYTSEGTGVRRYDVCTDTQLPDFASGLHGEAYALRLLPAGGLLVADSQDIHRLDAGGATTQTYFPGPGKWFSINLDPDGTSFWASDIQSGSGAYKLDIGSGSVVIGPIAVGSLATGVCVFGEITAGSGENCSNGVDDDGDTLVDCEDPQCAGLPVCTGATPTFTATPPTPTPTPPTPTPGPSVAPTPFACGFLWISAEFFSNPATIFRYNVAAGRIDRSTVPGILTHVANNLAFDGATLYLGTDGGETFRKADPFTAVPFFQTTYMPPTGADNLEDGAFRVANGHLYRASSIFGAGEMFETDTSGNVLATYVVNNVQTLVGLEFVGDQLYGTSLADGTYGTLTFNGGSWDFAPVAVTGIPAGHVWGGLAYDELNDRMYMTTNDNVAASFLWSFPPGGGAATLVSDLTSNGFPGGVIYPDGLACIPPPPTDQGVLWISGEFAPNPPPIYRYNLGAGTIDLVTTPGLTGNVVNNLATDGTALYLGTDEGTEFWKADPLTGVPFSMSSYSGTVDVTSLEDGAYRPSDGHLFRASNTNAGVDLYETDTDGTVLAAYPIASVKNLDGLEFVGDQLYGSSQLTHDIGRLDFDGTKWTYTPIPLLGSPVGHQYGGLAYDQQRGKFYLTTTNQSDAFLWQIDVNLETLTLVKNLTRRGGYPAGFIVPDGLAWVPTSPGPTATLTPTPTPTPICAAAPEVCRTPIASKQALLKLDDKPGGEKDKLLWKWKGPATSKTDYGNPDVVDVYDLCIYDGTGLVMSTLAPAAGVCVGKPCWKEKTTLFLYKDKAATPDGLTKVLLKTSATDGKAKILVKGQGGNLSLPSLSGLASPVTVQLKKSTGGPCFGAVFTAPFLKQEAGAFKDKSD